MGSWSSLEGGRGYWGALFPAQGKQSNVFRKLTTAVCIHTAVNVPHPQNSRCNVPWCFLELDMRPDDEPTKNPVVVQRLIPCTRSLYFRSGRHSDVLRKHFEIPKFRNRNLRAFAARFDLEIIGVFEIITSLQIPMEAGNSLNLKEFRNIGVRLEQP